MLSYWYVVLFLPYGFRISAIYFNTLYRVKVLCMTLQDVLAFRLCGSWVDRKIVEAASLLTRV